MGEKGVSMRGWLRRHSSQEATDHLQARVGAAQRSLGVGSSDEACDECRPTQRELEVHVLPEVVAERGQAQVIGQLEGCGGDRELCLDTRRQQRTDAV